MHWTAVLAKQRFRSSNAQVIDDLSCVGCGYNLRGSRVAGICPECGDPVAASLQVLAQPDRVSSGLDSLAWSLMGVVGTIFVFLGSMALGFAWIGVLILLIASVFRVSATYDLRFKAELESLVHVGPRLGLLWWMSLLDLVTCLALVAALYLFASDPATTGAILGSMCLAWIIQYGLGLLVLGSFGAALARHIDYDFIAREFVILMILLGVGAVAVVVTLASSALVGSLGLNLLNGVLTLLVGIVAMGFAFVGLLHLSQAAESERAVRDDVIATLPSEHPEKVPTAKVQELPPIELE